MKSQILRVLGQTDGYVSGQELCDTLQVSRTAVWKVMNQLKEDGYEIESVPSRGYRMLARPDQITSEAVGSRLNTAWTGREIHFYETIDSTNNEAKRLAEQGAPEGALILAETQTGGKGRRGRAWLTPAGSAVAMTLLLRPEIPPTCASMVTLVMGLAVAKACQEFCHIEPQIKWPNDVVADGRKICGILTEMSCEIDCINYVVIGTGINTNVECFPEELEQMAVSLHALTGTKPERAALIALCMEKFELYYRQFLKTQDLSLLMEEYNSMLAGRGGTVRVLEPGHEYCGISEGINAEGELQVRKEDGTVESVYAGEVSVRGLYGYV